MSEGEAERPDTNGFMLERGVIMQARDNFRIGNIGFKHDFYRFIGRKHHAGVCGDLEVVGEGEAERSRR